MKEFLYLAVAVCALVSLGELFSYDSRWRRACAASLSLILLATLLPAMVTLGGALSDFRFSFEEAVPPAGDSYMATAEEAYARGVKLSICDAFSLAAEDVAVSLRGFDFCAMRAEQITVSLSGRAVLADSFAIEDYIKALGADSWEVKLIVES